MILRARTILQLNLILILTSTEMKKLMKEVTIKEIFRFQLKRARIKFATFLVVIIES